MMNIFLMFKFYVYVGSFDIQTYPPMAEHLSKMVKENNVQWLSASEIYKLFFL